MYLFAVALVHRRRIILFHNASNLAHNASSEIMPRSEEVVNNRVTVLHLQNGQIKIVNELQI